ncbi:MAG: anhydro-N-acetylmuramic acid kinase [Burkholderiales bacterium]
MFDLTAWSISEHTKRYPPGTNSMSVCGGGADNRALMARFAALPPSATLARLSLWHTRSTSRPQALAWRAKQYADTKPVDLTRPISVAHRNIAGTPTLT